jgi:Uri superfamily endonuclease
MSYGMKRVLRHTSKNKKLRWHIDYLLNSHPFSHVIFAEVERKMECEVASKLRNTAFGEAPKFGSSDCNCKSHLFYFPSFSEAVTLSEKSYVELGLKPKILRIQELLRESPVI